MSVEPVFPRPLVLAALLVVMAGARVAQPSRSDAVGALAADVTTWTIIGRGGVCIRGLAGRAGRYGVRPGGRGTVSPLSSPQI